MPAETPAPPPPAAPVPPASEDDLVTTSHAKTVDRDLAEHDAPRRVRVPA